ncbi:class I SAM-dependent methyltransferase [Jidongwangia harbinensis]|uniref:class I SAM-dependent methyltransferase n=1 Tax=Jidongwangia harbinensis TaxID=2878561 RepID=UPI001CD9B28E|nr:class I SAM-dependent methyltransferase [Jidongwangia harbinensis]MCA2213014.1 class I SAM-dependent methyltransferase [Jidongwangia harbinensis]
MRYDEVLPALRAAYDGGAAERDGMPKQQFKLDERAAFLDRLRVAEARSLLEIGAGTGQDAAFFAAAGLRVVALDASPEMVARCRGKGLEAHVRDARRPGFPPASFDAVFTLNCLLHVPNADLPEVLRAVRDVVRPGGLVYVGLWGGRSSEGEIETDHLVPKRFFALRTDEEIIGYAGAAFEVLDFHTVDHGGLHFQSLTLVRPLDG